MIVGARLVVLKVWEQIKQLRLKSSSICFIISLKASYSLEGEGMVIKSCDFIINFNSCRQSNPSKQLIHLIAHSNMLLKQYSKISGLQYFDNFITLKEKEQILSIINHHEWCHHLRRPQQYYGIKYFQTKLEDSVLQPVNSLDHHPLSYFKFLIEKTINSNIFNNLDPPNQVLINKYCKSDKLGLHVEDTSAFGSIIVGISLGSTDYLRLVDASNKENAYLLELEDRSCYVLAGQARYQYRHGIGRVFNSQKYKKDQFQRISLTIRHVIDSRRKVQSRQYCQ